MSPISTFGSPNLPRVPGTFSWIGAFSRLRCGFVRPIGGFALRVRSAEGISEGAGGHFHLRVFLFRVLQVVDVLRDRWLPPLWGWT